MFDGKLVVNIACASDVGCFRFDVPALFVAVHRALEYHLAVFRDDLRVVSVSGNGLIRDDRLADVLHNLAVREIVFCLVGGGLGRVPVPFVDLRVVGLLGCRAGGDPQKQARRDESGVKSINSHAAERAVHWPLERSPRRWPGTCS